MSIYLPPDGLFSERMGLRKKDIMVLKENARYRVEAEYSPYQRDTCMVIYKKEYKAEIVWKVKEVGFFFIEKGVNGNREFLLDYNVDREDERDKAIGAMRTKRTPNLREINWFLTMFEEGVPTLLDEELIEQFEAIRVAFRLKNAK